MENEVATGLNRTGLDMAPMSRDDMIKFARSETALVPAGNSDQLSELRRSYALEADRVGSVPVPGKIKGVATTLKATMKGNKPSVLIDKLGERLAYERTGVRLYEALLVKASAASGGPMLDIPTLQRFRDDEESHFHMVGKYLEGLGADPTAMTPCADIAGVAGSGHLQVISDPRTTLAQALNSLLMVEMGDNAGWDLLVELAEDAGHADMAQAFTVALETERQHMESVRRWLREAVLDEAT
ncbi:ferritin-like domain-containing protein [Ramlibacter rhizophilus]|uniref:Ferritin-like domain-containing protein n=1 Tax=Ramlibacter rhizophilus TaxID=1781167 RepID=A0A4Z0BY87_9BURK|nr:ferritin-like domain-containing protein [Ramlibacter rhizophilus]TFZ04286.1 ferritin-like domain-containing protein [Ramlibacter rhizophilus]